MKIRNFYARPESLLVDDEKVKDFLKNIQKIFLVHRKFFSRKSPICSYGMPEWNHIKVLLNKDQRVLLKNTRKPSGSSSHRLPKCLIIKTLMCSYERPEGTLKEDQRVFSMKKRKSSQRMLDGFLKEDSKALSSKILSQKIGRYSLNDQKVFP